MSIRPVEGALPSKADTAYLPPCSLDKRRRIGHSDRVRRAGCTVVALVFASSCAQPTATETSDGPASNVSPRAASVTVADAVLDDGCDRAAPSAWLEIGTSATIALAQEPLVATIEADPGIVCSGGSTSVTVTVRNDGASPISIPSLRLMLGGDGMWKWDVGEVSNVALEAGQSVTVTTIATLPLVKPGEYRLFLYGYTGRGDLLIAAPRGE